MTWVTQIWRPSPFTLQCLHPPTSPPSRHSLPFSSFLTSLQQSSTVCDLQMPILPGQKFSADPFSLLWDQYFIHFPWWGIFLVGSAIYLFKVTMLVSISAWSERSVNRHVWVWGFQPSDECPSIRSVVAYLFKNVFHFCLYGECMCLCVHVHAEASRGQRTVFDVFF